MSLALSMPEDLTPRQVQTLKDTICKGATDQELELFVQICNSSGLNPFMKQIYAVPRGSKGGPTSIQPMVSIDGFRLIAERTKCYAPGREPTFVYGQNKKLHSATAYVKKKLPDGSWHEVTATALMQEYEQHSPIWQGKPHVMLAKCAEAMALRRAFPANLSGLYEENEINVKEMRGPEEDKPLLDAIPRATLDEVSKFQELYAQTTPAIKKLIDDRKSKDKISSDFDMPQELCNNFIRHMEAKLPAKVEVKQAPTVIESEKIEPKSEPKEDIRQMEAFL